MAEFNRELLLARFMAKAVFFSSILFSQCKLVVSEEHETAATDGRTIWINPKFMATLTVPEQVGVLAHEVGHVIFLHCQQLKAWIDASFAPDGHPMDSERHNQATDYVINDLLVGSGFTLPQCALLDPKYPHTLGSLEVYKRLPHTPPGGGGKPGQGGFDKHIPSQGSAGQEAQMAAAVANAARAAKAAGQLTGALGLLVDDIINPKLSWKELLPSVICNSSKDESTWAKPNRRRLAVNPVVMPGRRSHKCGEVVAVFDTSGSISMEDAASYLGELKGICHDSRPEKLHILWTDTRVAHHDELDDPEDIDEIIARCKRERLPGGGGTDMPAAFVWLQEKGITPTACIVFTDGCTPFGVAQQYPVIWAISTDGITAPWGQSVKLV